MWRSLALFCAVTALATEAKLTAFRRHGSEDVLQNGRMSGQSPTKAAGLVATGQDPKYTEQIASMKKDMYEKVGVSHEADYIVDRPTTVPPGHDGVMMPGSHKDLAADNGEMPAPAPAAPGPSPGPAPGPAPGPEPFYHGMLEKDLAKDVRHVDNETFAGDWGAEYGPHGPRGVHSPFQRRAMAPVMGSAAPRNVVWLLVGALLSVVTCAA